MGETIGIEWVKILMPFLKTQEFADIVKFIQQQRKKYKIYPDSENLFTAFKLCQYNDTKIVWLSQDIYKGDERNGLLFGINDTIFGIPATLDSIIANLEKEYSKLILDFDYSLHNWAKQGNLMLNIALTNEYEKPSSHTEQWKYFIEFILKELAKKEFLVWVLLGDEVQKYKSLIPDNHIIIETEHPGIVSQNKESFLDAKIFSKINNELWIRNIKQINWF
jgi:uracil-DNA glycosylase